MPFRKAEVRKELWVVLALVLFGGSDRVLADAPLGPSCVPPDSHGLAEGADVFPLRVSFYASEMAARASAGVQAKPTIEGTLARALTGRSTEVLRAVDVPDASSRRTYLPVLFSLLVPGTGEMYMGYYVRGAVLLAAEATAWTGYAHYHNKGLDSRAEYERFADRYWDYDRWVEDHLLWQDPMYAGETRTFERLDEIGRTEWDKWPGYHTWHSKEEDSQNYYENIGKYDWFISGWEDWDPENPTRETPLRLTYWGMRKKSEDELQRATNFVYLSVAARVISLVETVLLVRRGDSDSTRESSSSGFSIKARATGIASGEVALVVRFR